MLKLNEAVRNVLANTDLTISQAVNMASLNPARRIGLSASKGSIEEGKDADFAIVDDAIDVQATILGGRVIYQK